VHLFKVRWLRAVRSPMSVVSLMNEEAAKAERDFNSHSRLVDENEVRYVLKVSNFKQLEWGAAYDVSIASGPLYASHRNATISVVEKRKTGRSGIGSHFSCTGAIEHEYNMERADGFAGNRQTLGKIFVDMYSLEIKKITEEWEAMWEERSFRVILAVQTAFDGPLEDLRCTMLRQVREDWLAEAH